MFDFADLTNAEKEQDKAEYRTWFCFGETCMAALLALNIAVPAGFWFAGMTALPLAVIGAGTVFLPAFIFLPKLIRYAMKADTDAVLSTFGKNEHTRKVFWALFMATASLMLAQVVDPAAAQEIIKVLAGIVP
jgi:F0F1-type ATP synthase assembly protein I